MSREYSRDKRSPVPKDEMVSKVMSANKAKNTKPELLFRKALWERGLKGYRVNYKNVPGRPDIAFTKQKVAVFVNGCFWHRCPHCQLSIPKTNTEFWKEKFAKNTTRDKLKKEQLTSLGWEVLVFWECQLKRDIGEVVETLVKVLSK